MFSTPAGQICFPRIPRLIDCFSEMSFQFCTCVHVRSCVWILSKHSKPLTLQNYKNGVSCPPGPVRSLALCSAFWVA